MIAENDMLSAVFVFTYHQPPLLQSRVILSDTEKEVLGKALVLREASSLPFWEALMLSCFDQPTDNSQLIQAAMFHQSHSQSLQRIPRNDIIDGLLIERAESQSMDEQLSLSSLVEVKNVGYGHLPLLDFHCPESTENDGLVAETCKVLFESAAFVLSSGKSYHAVGINVLEEAAIRTFLARSLLLAPIVDSRYVAHQLLEGACALRLSRSAEKPEPRLKFSVT